MPDQRSNYEQGAEAGRIMEVLSRHEIHFTDIEDFQRDTLQRLARIELLLQQISDLGNSREASSKADVAARDDKVKETATALEKAAETRRKTEEDKRHADDQKWTPMSRLIAIVGPFIAIAAIIVTVLLTK